MRDSASALLHTATINGHPVRFFASPLGGPDMPWVALADLVGTVGLPDWWREQAVSGWPEAHPDKFRLVAVDGAEVLIVPDVAGLGFFAFLAQQGCEVDVPRREYDATATELFCVQHAHLSREEFTRASRFVALRHAMPDGPAH